MSSPPRGASGKKQRRRDARTRAKVLDLSYYLGDDWIDFTVTTSDALVNFYRNTCTSSYQPKKCPECKKYWVNCIVSATGRIQPRDLDRHYYNLPAEKEKCWEC